MQRQYVLEKLSVNKLNPGKLKQQLRSISKEAEANTTLGITAKLKGKTKPAVCSGGNDDVNANYRYTVTLVLTAAGDRAEQALDLVEKTVRKTAELQKWRVVGEAAIVEHFHNNNKERPTWVLPELTDKTLADNFGDIVDREAHIRTMHCSTCMFLRSNGLLRSHTILFGEPGSCKTSLILAMKDWYEKDSNVERVHIVDATAITKAGITNYMLDQADAGTLAEVYVFEEVEKFELNVLLPLISVMDGRGVITKLNARTDRKVQAKILVWMTCNDEDFIKKWHRGFLWSRCANKIPCVVPTRQQMEEIILPKKIQSINGDIRWAKLACDFAYDMLKTSDPREAITCLDGAERLVDGSYQKDRLKILQDANRL